MSFQATITPDFIARSISSAITKELEGLIRKRLQEEIDPIISELARDLASATTVNATGYLQQISKDNFGGPAVVIQLSFNNKNVEYTPEPKS